MKGKFIMMQIIAKAASAFGSEQRLHLIKEHSRVQSLKNKMF